MYVKNESDLAHKGPGSFGAAVCVSEGKPIAAAGTVLPRVVAILRMTYDVVGGILMSHAW